MDSFLWRAHRLFLYLIVAYVLLLAILATPYVQRHLLFAHALNWPLWQQSFNEPVRYGLAPFKTYFLNLTTSDNYTIAGWHVLSDPYYHTHTPYPTLTRSPLPPTAQSESLQQYPTIIYFHGNAGSRAMYHRVSILSTLTTRLGVNVVAVDYRGFAENKGKPSEEGLAKDARAVWDWLTVEMEVPDGSIALMGQSLGTGVASRLASDLGKEGILPRGLLLVSPYASLPDLMTTYTLFHFIPILAPLRAVPPVLRWYKGFLRDRFETTKVLPDVNTTIILLHAINDDIIPYSHAEMLFNAALNPLLPPPPERESMIQQLVKEETVESFATIKRFERPGKGDVLYLRTLYGGHNIISSMEGALDVVGRVLRIGAGHDQDHYGDRALE